MKILYIIFISFSFLFSTLKPLDNKPWTLLVYIAAVSDFNKTAVTNIKDMLTVGSSDNVNVIVYLTMEGDKHKKQTKKFYVKSGELVQLAPSMNRDSGHIASLSEAVQWALLDYPSDHLGVILCGHSSGILNKKDYLTKGFCHDFDSESYLTEKDCLNAFSWACDSIRGGKKIDFVALDGSFLASLEMAYALSSCVDYLVASQSKMSSDGFSYSAILSALKKENLDPLSLAKLMVKSYAKEHSNDTLSLLDLQSLDLLVQNLNAVCRVLKSYMKGENSENIKSNIKKCIAKNFCASFDDGTYIDLYQFYKNMLKKIPFFKLSKNIVSHFSAILQAGIDLFPLIVKEQVATKKYKDLGGISIYISHRSIDFSYYGSYWSMNNPLWLDLLETLFF